MIDKADIKIIIMIVAVMLFFAFAIWGLGHDKKERNKKYPPGSDIYCERQAGVRLKNMESRCIKYYFSDITK